MAAQKGEQNDECHGKAEARSKKDRKACTDKLGNDDGTAGNRHADGKFQIALNRLFHVFSSFPFGLLR